MSNSLQSHELQHKRLLCPSLSPWVCSNSYPLSWWCHPTISSSVAHFSSCPHFFPASVFSNESALHIRRPNTVASASASILPMNIQGWFPLGLTGLISLLSKGLSRVLSNITVWKHKFFRTRTSLWSNSHTYVTTGKTIALTIQTYVSKLMSLLFNTLSRFVIAILPRSKCLLFSWLLSPSTLILEPKKMKSDSFHIFPIYLLWSDGTVCHDLSFLNVEF